MAGEGDATVEQRLRAANRRLRASNERLAAENAALVSNVAGLQARVEALAAQVEELRARLGQSAKNSSRPPSSEGLAKKPAVPRRKGGRAGKQPGTPGAHLAQVADPDERVVHRPSVCDGCGAGLHAAEVVAVERRQVFDLPPVRLRVVEHAAQKRRCGACATVTAAAFPPEATAPACYGPRVRAAMAYLRAHQHLPVQRAAQLLADLVGAPIATGTVAGVLAEAAAAVAPAVAEIRAQLAASAVACFDETGARVAGKLHWVHSASTDTLTLYTVHAKRGRAAIDAAGVLGAFAGVAVHDGWSPYRGYAVEHALCNAHHLRELAAAAEDPAQDWAGFLAETLRCAHDWVADAKAAGRDRLDAHLLAALRARYDGHIAQGRDATPPRRRRTKAAALVARLDRHRDDVLRFAADFRVPFDNNQAERDLRMIKLQQKISGGWRTLDGAQHFAAVRSYISTARKQGHHVLDVLCDAFTGHPWLPTPAAAAQPLAAAA